MRTTPLLLLALTAATAACTAAAGDLAAPEGSTARILHIVPDSIVTVREDSVVTFVAVARAADGRETVADSVSWRSRDPVVARAVETGRVTAVSAGLAWIVAEAPWGADSVQVRVIVSFQAVYAGTDGTCAHSTTGHVYCWGWNANGEIGDGTTRDALRPRLAAGGLRFDRIASSSGTSCGLRGEGYLWCWGYNGVGQLGDGTREFFRTGPAPVAVDAPFDDIILGAGPTPCGHTSAGWWCWGWNRFNQILNGPLEIVHRLPARLVPPLAIAQLSTGGGHVCALAPDASTWCWGRNEYGELGDGSAVARFSPVAVTGAAPARLVVTGELHTCILDLGGSTWCWGDNTFGQIDRPSPTPFLTPTFVNTDGPLDTLVSARFHSCGLHGTIAHCWGLNDFGQLGDFANSTVPGFRQISVGTSHSCGLSVDGEVWCWGRNVYGALGNGTRRDSPQPVLVGWQR